MDKNKIQSTCCDFGISRLFGVLLLILGNTAGEAVAKSDSAPADLAGKTIEVTIPFLPGGGTDVWARAVLPFVGKLLPGSPKILIHNIAGGGSTKAANSFANQEENSGLSLMMSGPSNHLAYILGDDRVRYELDEWRALMAYRAGEVVYAAPNVGLKNICELARLSPRELVMANQSPASEDLLVLLALDLIGLEVSSVFGFRGRAPARQFFERGDANLDFQTTSAYRVFVQPQVAAGKAVPLFTLGAFDEVGNYVRDPVFPHLPSLGEAISCVSGKPPSGEAWQSWLRLYRTGLGSVKLMVLPRDTPDTFIRMYQKAIRDLLADESAVADIERTVGPNSLFDSDAAEQLMPAREVLPEATQRWLRDWVLQKYGVRL